MAHGRITGWATHLPERRLTNHDLAEFVDTTDEWIRERSGIAARHVDGKVTEMSTIAGRDALAMAGVDRPTMATRAACLSRDFMV